MARLKPGTEVQVRQVSGELWTCRVLKTSRKKRQGNTTNYLVKWITGPLMGREARLAPEVLR